TRILLESSAPVLARATMGYAALTVPQASVRTSTPPAGRWISARGSTVIDKHDANNGSADTRAIRAHGRGKLVEAGMRFLRDTAHFLMLSSTSLSRNLTIACGITSRKTLNVTLVKWFADQAQISLLH